MLEQTTSEKGFNLDQIVTHCSCILRFLFVITEARILIQDK